VERRPEDVEMLESSGLAKRSFSVVRTITPAAVPIGKKSCPCLGNGELTLTRCSSRRQAGCSFSEIRKYLVVLHCSIYNSRTCRAT